MTDIKFKNLVSVRQKKCQTCLTLLYILPCRVDDDLIIEFQRFGKLKADGFVPEVFHITDRNGYHIRGRIGQSSFSFGLPKKLDGTDLEKTSRRPEFESLLCGWLSKKMNMNIIR